MKPRTVIISPEARADLHWIYETISASASPVAAARYLDRIGTYCEGLELGSERGTRRDDVRPGLRIVGFERRIAFAFVVPPDRVEVLRVLYGGANWDEDLREEGSQ